MAMHGNRTVTRDDQQAPATPAVQVQIKSEPEDTVPNYTLDVKQVLGASKSDTLRPPTTLQTILTPIQQLKKRQVCKQP